MRLQNALASAHAVNHNVVIILTIVNLDLCGQVLLSA